MRLGRWCGSCTTAFDKHKIKFTCTRTVQSILQYATAVATVERENNAQRERGGAYFAFTVRIRYVDVDVGFSLFFLFCFVLFFLFLFGACVCEFYGTLSVYCIARNISNEIKSRAHYLTLQSLITFAEFSRSNAAAAVDDGDGVAVALERAARAKTANLFNIIIALRAASCELRTSLNVGRTQLRIRLWVFGLESTISFSWNFSYTEYTEYAMKLRIYSQLRICCVLNWTFAGWRLATVAGGRVDVCFIFIWFFFFRCATAISFASPSLCWPLLMSDVLNINVIKSYARIGGLLVCGFWFSFCFFRCDSIAIAVLFALCSIYHPNTTAILDDRFRCVTLFCIYFVSRVSVTLCFFAFISLFVQIEFLSTFAFNSFSFLLFFSSIFLCFVHFCFFIKRHTILYFFLLSFRFVCCCCCCNKIRKKLLESTYTRSMFIGTQVNTN